MASKDYIKMVKSRYTDLFKNDLYFDAFMKSVADVAMYYEDQNSTLFKNAFNIDASYGYGLDWIGKIVNQERELIGFNTNVYFGFDGAYKSDTFGTVDDPTIGGIFSSSINNDQTSSKLLSDEEYKNVLKARVISNNSRGTTDEFLQIIELLSFSDRNTVKTTTHGVIDLKIYQDKSGLLSYFLEKTNNRGSLIPVPLGYRIVQTYN